jgi:sulfide:quinone oxidoreductase
VGASQAVAQLLSDCRVRLIVGVKAQVRDPHLIELFPPLEAVTPDLIVALPELYAPALAGVPTNAERGFVTVDRQGAVRGLDHVYAAGDIIDAPVKNGGLAAQQAVAAADAIAALAGAEPPVRDPVAILDLMLIGGPEPLFIRSRMLDQHGINLEVSQEPLWSPADKIDAHYLAPRLVALDTARPSALAHPAGQLQVEPLRGSRR